MNPSAKQCINRVLAALPQETFRAPAKRVLWPYALAVIVASLAPFVFWPSLLTKRPASAGFFLKLPALLDAVCFIALRTKKRFGSRRASAGC
jgi:hypothetical protein